jgi:hypothetical protein
VKPLADDFLGLFESQAGQVVIDRDLGALAPGMRRETKNVGFEAAKYFQRQIVDEGPGVPGCLRPQTV